MTIVVDSDVEDTLAFMQSRIGADRLIAVSEAVANIAPLVWGQYPRREVSVLAFDNGQIIGSVTSPRAAT